MWDWAIWGALIVAALSGTAALALLAVRARTAWREVQEARRGFVRRLDELTAKGDATAERIALAGDTAELEESLGRLRMSLARLAVLRNALDEATVSFGRIVPLR